MLRENLRLNTLKERIVTSLKIYTIAIRFKEQKYCNHGNWCDKVNLSSNRHRKIEMHFKLYYKASNTNNFECLGLV